MRWSASRQELRLHDVFTHPRAPKQTVMSVRLRIERNPRLSNFTSYSTICQRPSKFALRRGYFDFAITSS